MAGVGEDVEKLEPTYPVCREGRGTAAEQTWQLPQMLVES